MHELSLVVATISLSLGGCGDSGKWTWDTAAQYPGLWTDQAGAGSIDEVLAPASRPDPCVP